MTEYHLLTHRIEYCTENVKEEINFLDARQKNLQLFLILEPSVNNTLKTHRMGFSHENIF